MPEHCPAAAPASPGFAWAEEFELGHRVMDATHREFVACVDTLLRIPDDRLADALHAFETHARAHFGEEDRQMAATAYGNAGCHVDEHAAVLKSLDEVQAALAAGRPEVVRRFARALADWFPEHAAVMDQGLAGWLLQRELGGSPVRLQRRGVAA